MVSNIVITNFSLAKAFRLALLSVLAAVIKTQLVVRRVLRLNLKFFSVIYHDIDLNLIKYVKVIVILWKPFDVSVVSCPAMQVKTHLVKNTSQLH